jgi:amino acid transporter
MPDSTASAAPTLRRVASRWEIVGIALNDVIGSGIYLLPAAAAAVLGAASLWAVLLAAVVVGLVVLCFAEASSYFDQPGSAYLYTRTAFGDFVGFEVGWMAWLTRVAAAASLSVGFVQALEFLVPAVGAGWRRALAIAVPLLALGVLNVLGIRATVRTSMAFAVSKIVPLLIFVAIGVFHVSPHTFRSQLIVEVGGLGGAALVLLFAFVGFENTPALAGEYRDPRRDVPFALIAQVAIVTAIYLSVQAVSLGTLPDLGRSSTPLADAATRFMGGWGGWLLTVGAVISILGTVSNSVLAGPRYLYAVARDGFLPRSLGRVQPRFRTPAVAVAVQTAITVPLALSGGFVELAALSVVSRLATYVGTAAALPVLRRRFPAERGFRVPGGVVIPVAVVMLSVGLTASASRANLVAAAAAVAVGALLYLLRPARRGASAG